jgi:rubrerythrin
MFQFVCSPLQPLTAELEKQITAANAWAAVVPTGSVKPAEHYGAFVPDSFSEIKERISKIEVALENESNTRKELETSLRNEIRKREESDLILANHIALIENLLHEKKIMKDELGRIADAHSTLHYCQICFENERRIRFSPCAHVISCEQCAIKIMSNDQASQRRCPICRTVITRTDTAFIV